MSFNLQSLLKDKNALYVTLFVAVTNVFAYLMFRQFDAIIFFIIIATIVSNFSKNMIIILLSAILTTNLAISIKMIGKVKEGMKNMKDDKKKKAAVETKNVKEPMSKNKNNKPKPTCSGDSCNKNKNNKEKFTQKLRPANINGDDNTDDIEDNATVDYASTLESAYDNLDKLLSSDAINNMSKDSQRLAEKQHALMGNIDKLHPMMEKAGSLLEGLNMGDMNNMLGNLQGKLDKLGGGEKPNKKED